MRRNAQFPTAVFDGCTTGNPDRNERNDDCQPDFNDFDQLAAELISVQTVMVTYAADIGYMPTEPANSATYSLNMDANGDATWLETYLPDAAPANGASYLVDVSANGIITWLPNYLPTSQPANGAIYNLAVDANGVVSWVVDANG
jgi:hypothetical protein